MTKKKAPPPEQPSQFTGGSHTPDNLKKPAPNSVELPFSEAAKKRNKPNILVRSAMFGFRNFKAIAFGAVASLLLLGYSLSEHDLEQSKKDVDIQEVVDVAVQENDLSAETLSRYIGAGQRYNQVSNPTAGYYYDNFVMDADVEEFCSEIEETIRERYVGKNGIADFQCSQDKIKITLEDGSVLTANAQGSMLDGPEESKSSNLEATVLRALTEHTTADDDYFNSFGSQTISTFWGDVSEKDTVCKNILDEVNEHFAGKVEMICQSRREIRFTVPATGETVVAEPDNGITVKNYNPKPGS